ncbi:MAG: integral membrane protein terc [Planctomycetota bacterium]|nr:MAG: integral membrane protein terc [Planctomycetota bacterium]
MLAQIIPWLASHGIELNGENLAAVGLLVVLEAILSADNAIVLALLAYSLPKEKQKVALKIGIWCAFLFRIIAVVFLLELLKIPATKRIALALGGAYLCWLPIKHFRAKVKGGLKTEGEGPAVAAATSLFGMSLFWSVVARIEFTDIVFSVDSILVAMAASKVPWVIITGGVLGIIAMRFVAGGFLKVIERFPRVVDGAYVIVGVAGMKMLVDLAHMLATHNTPDEHFEKLLKLVSFGLIAVIFTASLLLGRRKSGDDEEDTPEAGLDEPNGTAGKPEVTPAAPEPPKPV